MFTLREKEKGEGRRLDPVVDVHVGVDEALPPNWQSQPSQFAKHLQITAKRRRGPGGEAEVQKEPPGSLPC